MPPRKRTRSKRTAPEETQRIPIEDLDEESSRLADLVADDAVTPDQRRTGKSESSAGGASSSSSAGPKVPGLSRSTRRLTALLMAQNPPTLPQTSMLGDDALSFSDDSDSDRSGGEHHTRQKGRGEETSPPRTSNTRLQRGSATDTGDNSPVGRLTSGRHTVSLANTMKQFTATAAAPHHLAITSAYVSRPFKPPSSTARLAAAAAAAAGITTATTTMAAAAGARRGSDRAVMAFIETQRADHETVTAPTAVPAASRDSDSSSSGPHVPALTGGTEKVLLSQREAATHSASGGDEDVLAGSAEAPSTPSAPFTRPVEAASRRGGRSRGRDGVDVLGAGAESFPPEEDEDDDDARSHLAESGEQGLPGGEVLFDSLGGPGPLADGALRASERDGGGADTPAEEAISSTASTPRLMVTPQLAVPHLLGGGSLGKMSPLSVPPMASLSNQERRLAQTRVTGGVAGDDAESTPGTAIGTVDDYAQTLAVYDLSLRSAAPVGLFESLPLEEVLDADAEDEDVVACADTGPGNVRSARSRPTPAAQASALAETVDDGCYKGAVLDDTDGGDGSEQTAGGGEPLSARGVLGDEVTGERRPTVATHAMLVQSARAAMSRSTPGTDPFLDVTPQPSFSLRGRRRSPEQKKKKSTSRRHTPPPNAASSTLHSSVADHSQAAFTVGMRVEARWGSIWYPAIVSEDACGGYVQVRWAKGDEDDLMHLKLREVRLPMSTAALTEAAPRRKDTSHSDTPASSATAAVGPSRDGLSDLTASQLAELVELRVLPPDTVLPTPMAADVSPGEARRRVRDGETDAHASAATVTNAKQQRREDDSASPVDAAQPLLHVHSSHLVVFDACAPKETRLAAAARGVPCLRDATWLTDYDAFLSVAGRVGELYHALETTEEEAEAGEAVPHGASEASPEDSLAPPLCVVLVENGGVANASDKAEDALQGIAETSPAAAWEVLVAHALGLAAVSTAWLAHCTKQEAGQTESARCPLPQESELLHVLRHYTSPRPSNGPQHASHAPPSGGDALERDKTGGPFAQVSAASLWSAPACFIPWHASGRFLCGSRVYMPLLTQLGQDPMARLVRAAGGVPVPASGPAPKHHNFDFLYFPPGTNTERAHNAVLTASPSLSGVPLLELPWLVKNIEAQFARRVRTVQQWWAARLAAPSAHKAFATGAAPVHVISPWSAPRASLASLVKTEADDADEKHGENPRWPRAELPVLEAQEEEAEVAAGQSDRVLARPPPLTVATTSRSPAKHVGSDKSGRSPSGGISPTTIAAIKARGTRRCGSSTGSTTNWPTRTGGEAEASHGTGNDHTHVIHAHTATHRMLSYPADTVGQHVGDDVNRSTHGAETTGSSPFARLCDCAEHPPINEGEDYYYRVPLVSSVRKRKRSRDGAPGPSIVSTAAAASTAIACELALGRVVGVDHNVYAQDADRTEAHREGETGDDEGHQDRHDGSHCLVRLQLYTVRRVVMRQNPITGELEQQTTVALTRRLTRVPPSSLLFDVPVYVVGASALRHVYVLEEEEGDDGAVLAEEGVLTDADQREGSSSASRAEAWSGVSHAPAPTAPLSPPRPTVRLDGVGANVESERRQRPLFYGSAAPLPGRRMER